MSLAKERPCQRQPEKWRMMCLATAMTLKANAAAAGVRSLLGPVKYGMACGWTRRSGNIQCAIECAFIECRGHMALQRQVARRAQSASKRIARQAAPYS